MDVALNRLDPMLPDPVESRRRAAGRFVRIVYGTCVFGLLLFFVIYFGGPLVFLGGSGIVSAPRQVVSLPVTVQVVSLRVEPGDTVAKGAEIAVIRSPQRDETISNYMRGLVDLAGREAELRIRERVARESLPAARAYLELTEEAVNRVEAATSGGMSLNYRLDIRNARAQALKAVASQEAEAAETSAQIETLSGLRQGLQERLDEAERNFAGGRVVAPIAGIVSRRLARAGQSLVAGAAIAEIYDTTGIYVDWYIPNRRLVEPRAGNPVFVVYGNRRITGTIEEILPVSDMLGPPDALAQSQRQSAQIARIRLSPDTPPPPLRADVTIHMYYSSAIGRAADALVDFLRLR